MKEESNKSAEKKVIDTKPVNQKVSFKMPLVGQPIDSNRCNDFRGPTKKINQKVILHDEKMRQRP